MSVTTTTAQRDALYEELLGELTGVGDIYLCLAKGDGEAARRLWERFECELRLLDAIGWSPVAPEEQFRLEMPGDVLVRALGHLHAGAERAVSAHLHEPRDAAEAAQRGLWVLGACRDALTQLAAEEDRS